MRSRSQCVGLDVDHRPNESLAPPMTSGAETRAFFRDPDGQLFEISEYRA
jgi:hypothetical protein